MAIKAAELQVVIGADTSPAVQGIHGAMGIISQTASTALGVFTGNLMMQAVGSLGNLAGAGVEAVGEFERMSATLQTLVKRDLQNTGQSLDLAGEKTRELSQWVQRLAKESPFDASGVTTALRTAMAYGFTADQAQRLTKATIDFAAGSGQSSEVMNQVALALGQIQAKGKLAGQEMLQLVNAGIDVRDALQKYLGKPAEEVSEMLEKGMVDANTAIEAIVTTMEKDFGGAAKEQSQTVSGLISTFQELKQMGLRELFTGIVEAVRPVTAAFLEWLSGEGINQLRELGAQLGAFAVSAVQLGQAMMPVITDVFEWIRAHGAEVASALAGIFLVFQTSSFISSIPTTIAAIGTALAAINLPLVAIAAAVGLLAAAWTGNWFGIRDTLTEVWNNSIQPAIGQLLAWLQTNIPVALNALAGIWQSVWGAIVNIFNAIFPIILAVWKAFRSAFEGDWYAFGAYLRDAWDLAWKNLVTILKGAWELIKTAVTNLIQNVITIFKTTDWGAVGKNIITGIANGIVGAIGFVIEAAKRAAKAALDAAKGFLGIQSPSKLFETEVGEQIVAGWAKGIEKAMPSLNAVVAQGSALTADSAKASAQTAVRPGVTVQNVQIVFSDTTLTPETFGSALKQLEWMYS